MITRNLRIALLLSLSLHVFFMSAIGLVTPGSLKRDASFTRIDFLGPILSKTAFDIMLENITNPLETLYGNTSDPEKDSFLEIPMEKVEPEVPRFPENFEKKVESQIIAGLTGFKAVPGIFLDTAQNNSSKNPRFSAPGLKNDENSRKVIYRPEMPSFPGGMYGEKAVYKVRTRILVDKSGTVKSVELLTKTGYPNLDILVTEYIRRWIFEPAKNYTLNDDWLIREIIFETGEYDD
ncbi:MAG: energy transducer TonB [Candidatus Omnitrophota bacterium]